jgi:3-oxoadipate:acetyl-CoA acetyltransferase
MTGEHAPLIVNAALTGMVPTKDENPAVPVTPDEIADDARRCVEAGAAIVHVHARDEDGRPTYRKEVYAEIIQAVRNRCPEVIVCVSTSGRTFKELDERADVLELEGDLKPELASLTLGSLNFPQQASVNEPAMIQDLAERMNERGIVPELEVFDFGMVDYAKFLLAREVIRPPLLFNLLLGSLGTLSASAVNLATLAASLPEGSTWAGAGIGRSQFFVNSLAIAMGGHVRVGLEDNLWLDVRKERPASNPELVDRLARLAVALERTIATPDQARRIIGLPARTLSPVAG